VTVTIKLNNFKNSRASKAFQTAPINKNIIYDSPVHLGIRFDDKGKIYFICMGSKTKEIKKILGLNDDLEDCYGSVSLTV
jgi:hypothetical protein